MSYIGKQPIRTALTSSDIEDGVITAAKIEDGAVVAAEIASNAVTTAKINADAVTSAKIADNAISEEHLDATVVTGLTALEAEPADTDEFLVSDAGTLKRIDYSHIKGGVEDGAITKAKLADQVDIFSGTSLSAADLGSGVHIKTADSGGDVNADASQLVLEGNTNAGLTILGGTGNACRIHFGDSGDNDIGSIKYAHDDNAMLFTTNATVGMTIDSNQIISKSSQPMCYVCVGNTTGVKVQVNSAGFTQVIFDHERFDVGGNYNTSNGNFTVPVAGYYACHASIRTFNTEQSNGYIQARIQGNNQGCNEVIHLIASGNSATCNNSFVGYFDANDTITCTIYNSADDNYKYGEGGNYNDTHMSIYKVG